MRRASVQADISPLTEFPRRTPWHARLPVGFTAPAWALVYPSEGRMAENETPQGEMPVEGEAKQETDWKAEARKWEARAKENLASAKANEGAAQRLAEIEEAQKTEAQKAQERLEAAERRAQELELKAARAEVAAAKGVPVALLTGSTQAELEASADALIEFRGAQEPQKLYVPNEGKSTDLPLNGDGLEQSLKKALGIV